MWTLHAGWQENHQSSIWLLWVPLQSLSLSTQRSDGVPHRYKTNSHWIKPQCRCNGRIQPKNLGYPRKPHFNDCHHSNKKLNHTWIERLSNTSISQTQNHQISPYQNRCLQVLPKPTQGCLPKVHWNQHQSWLPKEHQQKQCGRKGY